MKKTAMAILLALVLAPAVSFAQVRILIGPPERVVEVRGNPPDRGYVWVDGYHRYEADHSDRRALAVREASIDGEIERAPCGALSLQMRNAREVWCGFRPGWPTRCGDEERRLPGRRLRREEGKERKDCLPGLELQ